jgi:hypothetical protein
LPIALIVVISKKMCENEHLLADFSRVLLIALIALQNQMGAKVLLIGLTFADCPQPLNYAIFTTI